MIEWFSDLVILGTLYEFEGINFYEAITQDPDYYLYRNEVNLLRQCVDEVVSAIRRGVRGRPTDANKVRPIVFKTQMMADNATRTV